MYNVDNTAGARSLSQRTGVSDADRASESMVDAERPWSSSASYSPRPITDAKELAMRAKDIYW